MMTNQNGGGQSERREFWKQQLEIFSRSGLSVQAFCQEKNLGYSSFCAWRKRLIGITPAKAARQARATDTIAIKVLPEVYEGTSATFRIAIEGVALEFSSAAQPEWVASVLLALHSQRSGRC